MKITYSRVLAVIVKSASDLVFSSNPQLSYSFKHEIVVEWAAATYQSLWNVCYRIFCALQHYFTDEYIQQEFSSQHGASAVLLSKICFFSAFLADVHIERVISIMSFYNLIHFTLEHIRSQEHFNIFIIHFLARNFIGNGRKLTQEVWHRISMKWDSLKVFDQPNDIVEAIMCLLYREGVEQERSCGTSWSRLPCEAADLFRDGLVNKVDDDEGMAVDGEVYGAMDEYLEEYPMEDIEESLQDVSMD